MVRRLEDLVAFQFAENFTGEVHQLINASADASRHWKYRDQLQEAASGVERTIAEGFGRFGPAEFAQFLRYALASLTEATTCLKDGVKRGYFHDSDIEPALTWARRCKEVTLKLLASQARRAGPIDRPDAPRRSRRPARPRKSPPGRRNAN